jgi:hypothetical protein
MNALWSDPVFTRQIVCTVVLLGVTISSLEWLVPAAKLEADWLFDSASFKFVWMERWWRPFGLRLVLALRLACALVFLASLLAGRGSFAGKASVLGAGLLCLPLRLYSPMGVLMALDGAEHFFTSVLLALGVTFFLHSPVALEVALAFVAVQACLEYASAGWSKIAGWRGWVSGQYLLQVLASSNYGNPRAAAFVRSHPATGRFLSLSVIAIEIATPFALVLPAPFGECLLVAAFSFHLGAAAVMGLNTFVWAFPAAYPAILHCRHLLFAR